MAVFAQDTSYVGCLGISGPGQPTTAVDIVAVVRKRAEGLFEPSSIRLDSCRELSVFAIGGLRRIERPKEPVTASAINDQVRFGNPRRQISSAQCQHVGALFFKRLALSGVHVNLNPPRFSDVFF